jgi:phosphomethylpyrimidine synthase
MTRKDDPAVVPHLDRPWTLPPVGGNPGQDPKATTPGSFANTPDIGGPLSFSSPDSRAMPAPSDKTAWDFLPDGWSTTLAPDTSTFAPDTTTLSRDHEGATPATRDQRDDATNPETSTRSRDRQGATPATRDQKEYATPPESLPDSRGSGSKSFQQADGRLRTVTHPADFAPVTQLEHARLGTITPEMQRVAERETHLTPEQVRDEVAAGRMVIPANRVHLQHKLDPMCIGRASKTKVNANMGASPVASNIDEEIEKLHWAEKWGGDTVMDLSTGGDLDATRTALIHNSTVPIGTVPIYSMIIGKKIEDLDEQMILDTVRHQAEQGVDYFTIHAGVLREHLKFARDRLIGLVSRGGSLLAKWMLHHRQQNPMNTAWEKICDVMHEYDVTFSIGDGCRPGGLADATDDLQLLELAEIGKLTERAWRKGIQVMVEGPGHVPFDQIEFNMKAQRRLCHGAPFYVLGPLVTDIFPGYDHITSCIGATAAAYHGASMLCYVTPKEHLGLPKKDDVKQGCIAYKIAAHSADIALGIPGTRDRDDDLTKARAALNWQKHFDLSFDPDTARAYHDEDLDVDTDFCAMCGHDWCSVRISKEIQDFFSGKAEGFERGKPVKSAALTPEQQAILEQRGHLSPEEIHKLAAKAKGKLKAADESGKATCHSDYVDPETAKQKLTQLGVGVATNESVI